MGVRTAPLPGAWFPDRAWDHLPCMGHELDRPLEACAGAVHGVSSRAWGLRLRTTAELRVGTFLTRCPVDRRAAGAPGSDQRSDRAAAARTAGSRDRASGTASSHADGRRCGSGQCVHHHPQRGSPRPARGPDAAAPAVVASGKDHLLTARAF